MIVLLAGCTPDAANVRLDPAPEPGRVYPLRGNVVFHDSASSIARACGGPVCACVRLGTAHVPMVRHWHDAANLETFAHEGLHLLGFGHPRAVRGGCWR